MTTTTKGPAVQIAGHAVHHEQQHTVTLAEPVSAVIDTPSASWRGVASQRSVQIVRLSLFWTFNPASDHAPVVSLWATSDYGLEASSRDNPDLLSVFAEVIEATRPDLLTWGPPIDNTRYYGRSLPIIAKRLDA